MQWRSTHSRSARSGGDWAEQLAGLVALTGGDVGRIPSLLPGLASTTGINLPNTCRVRLQQLADAANHHLNNSEVVMLLMQHAQWSTTHCCLVRLATKQLSLGATQNAAALTGDFMAVRELGNQVLVALWLCHGRRRLRRLRMVLGRNEDQIATSILWACDISMLRTLHISTCGSLSKIASTTSTGSIHHHYLMGAHYYAGKEDNDVDSYEMVTPAHLEQVTDDLFPHKALPTPFQLPMLDELMLNVLDGSVLWKALATCTMPNLRRLELAVPRSWTRGATILEKHEEFTPNLKVLKLNSIGNILFQFSSTVVQELDLVDSGKTTCCSRLFCPNLHTIGIRKGLYGNGFWPLSEEGYAFIDWKGPTLAADPVNPDGPVLQIGADWEEREYFWKIPLSSPSLCRLGRPSEHMRANQPFVPVMLETSPNCAIHLY